MTKFVLLLCAFCLTTGWVDKDSLQQRVEEVQSHRKALEARIVILEIGARVEADLSRLDGAIARDKRRVDVDLQKVKRRNIQEQIEEVLYDGFVFRGDDGRARIEAPKALVERFASRILDCWIEGGDFKFFLFQRIEIGTTVPPRNIPPGDDVPFNDLVKMISEEGDIKSLVAELSKHKVRLHFGDLKKLDGIFRDNFPTRYLVALQREHDRLVAKRKLVDECLDEEKRLREGLERETAFTNTLLRQGTATAEQLKALKDFAVAYQLHNRKVSELRSR